MTATVLPWALLVVVLAAVLWWHRRHRAMWRALLHTSETTLLRMQQAIESASDAIGIGDFEGNSLYHNRAHIALFGYTVEELNAVPGIGVLFANPVDAEKIHASVRMGRSWSGETDVKTKDGRVIPAFVRADLIRDERGTPVGIFGVFTDITERRRTARILDEERQRLAITLQAIAEGVITTDAQGRVVLINPVAEQLTGWTAAEALGRPLATVLPLLDEQTRAPREPRVRRDSESSRSPSDLQVQVLCTRDGRERLIATMAAALDPHHEAGQGLVIVFRDVTAERRHAEEQARASRLEALGLMAGGIAHDFANLLTGILGHLSLTQMTEGLPAEAQQQLADVERAAWRARDLTQQLLTFAKGGSPEKSVISLSPLIQDSVALALRTAPEVTTHLEVADDLWKVDADAVQFGQVINNLAWNAAQAMSQCGRLHVTARNFPAGPPAGGALAGQAVVGVSVQDAGPGIAPAHLARIFDPFFTTKKTGTGLGLATVYSIVKKHGGDLLVESAPGSGTTFWIYLPMAREERVKAASSSPFDRHPS